LATSGVSDIIPKDYTMSKPLEPEKLEQLEDIDIDAAKRNDETLQEHGEIDICDEKYNKKLNRRLDLRVLPLCCWVYLLNFLDRGELSLFSGSMTARINY
jgi:hypothetical protein